MDIRYHLIYVADLPVGKDLVVVIASIIFAFYCKKVDQWLLLFDVLVKYTVVTCIV